MVVQKAQSAIEFITAYSWAFLLILVVGFIAFYYITSQQPAPQCSFGTDLQCQSFQFVKNSTGSMMLTFQLSNGMGKAVSFTGDQVITVTNIGKSGVNNYPGSCWSRSIIAHGGDPIYCTFNITDSDVIPSLNRNVKFDVALSYVDCETSPDYPLDCYGGLNRTYRGAITAPFEARPSGVASFCGDGTCDLAHGESCSTCTQDCGPCLVPTCQPDCTFNSVCNLSCVGINGCAGFLQACNNYSSGYRCSDSAGGTTGALNYKIQCCNNGLSPALNCYQITPTTVGYCGNGACDPTHENCSTCPQECGPCPSTCLLDCTMGDNTCHKSCYDSGKCWGFNSVCDGWANGSLRCSDSVGEFSGSLDYYSVCCTGVINPALHCYQNTSKTIGYCGDNNCAASRGETCSNCPQDCGTCPLGCQPDCMFSGVCNSNCPGCSNVLPLCNATQGSGFLTCVNSTGGTLGITNYNVSCCTNNGQPPASCGSNSTCPHTTLWCNGNQNCSADTLSTPCNFSCAGGVCGTSCTPTCTQTCTNCPPSTLCQLGICQLVVTYYQSTANLCGYNTTTDSSCHSGLTNINCSAHNYFPSSSCSPTPPSFACTPETASASGSCATCGDCAGGSDTCNIAACGSTYGCASGVCDGQATGASHCVTPSNIEGATCYCDQMCGGGMTCNTTTNKCSRYYQSLPNLCAYYNGTSSSCGVASTSCPAGQKVSASQSCILGAQLSCVSGYCAVCGDCSGSGDNCVKQSCGATGFGCTAGNVCNGQGTGAGNCVAPSSTEGATCYCDQMCGGGMTCNTTTNKCSRYYQSLPNLCAYYNGTSSSCGVASTSCPAGQKVSASQSCILGAQLSCVSGYCAVCGDCSGSGDTCNAVACGTTNSYGCGSGSYCSGGKGAGSCNAPFASGAACNCTAQCQSGLTCIGGPPGTCKAYYLSTPNLCGYSKTSVAGCGSGLTTTYCTSGNYYPSQSCSLTPTNFACIAETSSASCAICGNCAGGADTCSIATCNTNYGCTGGKICNGVGTGSSNCISSGSIANGQPCNCNQVCASGQCSGGTCQSSGCSPACTTPPATFCCNCGQAGWYPGCGYICTTASGCTKIYCGTHCT